MSDEQRNITTSAECKSETRYLSALKYDLELDDEVKTFHFCDTPGFGDTAGPEVDIANGIGIKLGIVQSKSIRPVVLLSKKS
jgi:hypothetical protein